MFLSLHAIREVLDMPCSAERFAEFNTFTGSTYAIHAGRVTGGACRGPVDYDAIRPVVYLVHGETLSYKLAFVKNERTVFTTSPIVGARVLWGVLS